MKSHEKQAFIKWSAARQQFLTKNFHGIFTEIRGISRNFPPCRAEHGGISKTAQKINIYYSLAENPCTVTFAVVHLQPFRKNCYLCRCNQPNLFMTTQNFVAIDFETMTVRRTSACAVGLAIVLDGVIHRKFYSLIKPIPDDEQRTNTFVHGITPEMVQFAPTFEMLFPTLRDFMSGLPIVCHNRNTDINILRDCMEYYGLHGIDVDNNICTYELTGQPLEACCAKYGINIGAHHDALDDAVACAKVMLAVNGMVVSSVGGGSLRVIIADKTNRSYDRATLDPLADDQVSDQSTPFFHASVVITGVFEAYPNRNELGKRLQSLGADINTAISGKTNVVVMGNGAGPSKVKKIEDLRAKGHDIRIIYEPELVQILGD